MDEEDRFSASSAESERDNEQDEVMEDAEEGDNDAEPEAEADNDEDNNDEENDDDEEADNDGGGESQQDANTEEKLPGKLKLKSDSPQAGHSSLPLRPMLRPEALTAKIYDIVPTMAAPQSTSVNAMAITPDLRYWITGGSDGYIRKYEGPGTINGKLALTVAQRHPFVDSVTKAGILMSYWENEEPSLPGGRGDQEHILSPVYALAVHSEALWLLSGLESGAISLQSIRHDEGKRICCLQQHTNAVSVLKLAPDERSVLSGGWDKNIYDWDLNTGQTIRSFDGSGGQISSIELRPASGALIPAEADEPLPSDTISTNNRAPIINRAGFTTHTNGLSPKPPERVESFEARDTQASPAHESLFGGSDAGSLFGETAGEQPFGHDDDEFGTAMDMMPGHEGGMDHSADMAMASMNDTDTTKETDKETALPVQVSVPEEDAMDIDSAATAATSSLGQGPDASTAAPPSEATDPAQMGSALPDLTAGTNAAASSEQTEQSQLDQIKQEGSQDGARLQDDSQQPPTLLADGTVAPTQEASKRSQSPMMVGEQSSPHYAYDQAQTLSTTTFLSSAMDGTIRIWDRRVPNPVARIGTRTGVPPWCMSACWSPDGNNIYAGRRNGTVEEFHIAKARRSWEPERVLKFPAGSGAVSALQPMPNGRHLVW